MDDLHKLANQNKWAQDPLDYYLNARPSVSEINIGTPLNSRGKQTLDKFMSPFGSKQAGPITHYQKASSIQVFGHNSAYVHKSSPSSNYAAKIERHHLFTKHLVNRIKAGGYRDCMRDQSTNSAASAQQ